MIIILVIKEGQNKTLMISYYKEIFSYVTKSISDKGSAGDITQETFARVIKAGKKKPIENERAFLYRVAKNLIIDVGRNKTSTTSKEVVYDEEQHIDTKDITKDSFEKDRQNKLLKQAIQKLSKQKRQVFILYMIDGFSRNEIAVKFNMTVNAVDLNISRASTQLKKIIKELEGDDV